MNMLPARDEQEFQLLPDEDVAFVKGWMSWTDSHVNWLEKTKVISGQPGWGKLDAVAMISKNEGAIFVFNPTSRHGNFSVSLDASAGFTCNASSLLLIRVTGSSERAFKPYDLDLLNCTEQLTVSVPPTAAIVFEVILHDQSGLTKPILLGAPGQVEYEDQILHVRNTQGHAGAESNLVVLLPEMVSVSKLLVNENIIDVRSSVRHSSGHQSLVIHGKWSGEIFQKEIGNATNFKGGHFDASFMVPQSALDQLQALNESYPLVYDLDPEGNNDANVPWLAPGRLLIFVKYRPLMNDTMNVTGSIDGIPILMRKAYNTIVASAQRFIGYWSDVTAHIKAGQRQELRLDLPELSPGVYREQQGFIPAGNDLGTENTTVPQAERHCTSERDCVGFTFEKKDSSRTCNAIMDTEKILYKSASGGHGTGASTWCSFLKPTLLDGIFFDNVQTIVSQEFVHT